MRHLLACVVVLATFNGAAQSMPYNPDANDDGYIGGADLLSLLPLYGQQVGIDSSLTCDYDGTPIEEFFGNVWNGDIFIDSILVQYHTVDSAEVFIAGCPDPVWETVSYERAWVGSASNGSSWNTFQLGHLKEFYFTFNGSSGEFSFYIKDTEVLTTGLDDILGFYQATAMTHEGANEGWFIPFPSNAASMDEDGINFENWSGFLSEATHVNILPYWHYAE